ncbi:MAG: phosphatidylserine/phosphatidylglycerophosphate/cardiolipinsynthase-like protein [Frankiales bacterium]|nr:phosphatidylserine/phosphatidylglycerophosphate/cardiolipinsynthase-like protein [Frankiales bacterium]
MISDWFLTSTERRNDATRLQAWSEGNSAQPLIHGASYFRELQRCVAAMQAGDLLLFTDWRGDPDELLTQDASVGSTLCDAATRGVDVRGLVWRSHGDRLSFSAKENRHLGEEIEAAGGECLLDMRVRIGGSHHQKFVVLRHPRHPERDVAFVGGIDLCHSRRDDADHGGDPQAQPMAAVYGTSPPWHDAMVALRGPVVADVETVFRERWDDPQPLTRSPFRWVTERLRSEERRGLPLPPELPPPPATGPHAVQLLRTYPDRRRYEFAPHGERSIAHGYAKVLRRANRLVYLEDQYLWSHSVARTFADALRARPELHLIAVVPHHPDQDGMISQPPNLLGRQQALSLLVAAGGERVAVYGVENHAGTPVYVHAKVCVVDDTWASIGSDNVNLRSWTHDSELSAAVLDETRDTRAPLDPGGHGDGARAYARDLRLQLMREHLDLADGDPGDQDLLDPDRAFAAVRTSARKLQAWHDDGAQGQRPPGRLRPLDPGAPVTAAWSRLLYRTVYDPDGRPRSLRHRDAF